MNAFTFVQIEEEWGSGEFVIKDDEDIHSANERRLTEIVGSVGGKLHTGRSRNDQIATDTRLWLIEELEGIRSNVRSLLATFCDRAEAEIDVLIPGELSSLFFGTVFKVLHIYSPHKL